MIAKTALAGLAWLFATTALAQTPSAELARPPAGATHYVIESTGAKHGDSWTWRAADGTRMGRETWNLRGQQWDEDEAGRAGPDGMPAVFTVRGRTPQGDAGESFTVEGGKAQWKSPVDAGAGAYATPAFYVAQGGTIDANA